MVVILTLQSQIMIKKRLNVLLAEDDDENGNVNFFGKALIESPICSCLTVMQDGVQLMDYLSTNLRHLPDLLFLDLNLFRKNGVECLYEIKADDALKDLPVVIF